LPWRCLAPVTLPAYPLCIAYSRSIRPRDGPDRLSRLRAGLLQGCCRGGRVCRLRSRLLLCRGTSRWLPGVSVVINVTKRIAESLLMMVPTTNEFWLTCLAMRSDAKSVVLRPASTTPTGASNAKPAQISLANTRFVDLLTNSVSDCGALAWCFASCYVCGV